LTWHCRPLYRKSKPQRLPAEDGQRHQQHEPQQLPGRTGIVGGCFLEPRSLSRRSARTSPARAISLPTGRLPVRAVRWAGRWTRCRTKPATRTRSGS
jgi:hypothetical protein